MSQYYFIGTQLPEIQIGRPPKISLQEFMTLLHENLSESDYAKISAISNYYDILNLQAYWKGETLNALGKLNFQEIEEALATRLEFPHYVFAFLDKYDNTQDRLRHFSELFATFFREEIKNASGILREYFIRERELRLVLLAFRAKQLGRDIHVELQHEDPNDEIVSQILAQKDAPQYVPPEKYAEIGPLFVKYYEQPAELQKALLEYRFNQMELLLGLDLFSIDRILVYFIKLIAVESWHNLHK